MSAPPRFDSSRALVLFSGGQDSSTSLVWALERFETVETVAFDYGQRHSVELEARRAVLAALRGFRPEWDRRLAEDHLLDLTALSAIGETAMTADIAIAFDESGLPNTFVPGRNLAFLVLAGALAWRRGIGTLVGGMCEADYSGYPDCRSDAVAAMERALRLGMDWPGAVATPLMHMTKAESWHLLRDVGGDALVALVAEHSHSCYVGDRSRRFDWGHGCGECPACQLRAKGWREAFPEQARSD